MKYEGDIAEIDLSSRLVEFWSEKFTGALRFENDAIIKILYLKAGDILSASTNDRTDSIDEILLRSGKVTREHVKQALGKRKETESLGDALLNLGFITKKELTWARRVQIVGILRSIMGWQTGTYTIVADYLPKREEGTLFPLPQIILELILTDQDRQRFESELEGGSVVYRKSPIFDERYVALGLNQDADAILASADGNRTAAEVAHDSTTDPFNVYKLLYALEVLGLLERATKPEVTPEVQDFAALSTGTTEMSLEGLAFNGGTGTIADVPLEYPVPPIGQTVEISTEDFAPPPPLPAPSMAALASEPVADSYAPSFDESVPHALNEPEELRFDEPEPPVAASLPSPRPSPSKRPVISHGRKQRNLKPLAFFLGAIVLGGLLFGGWKWWSDRKAAEIAASTPAPAPRSKPAPPPIVPPATTTDTTAGDTTATATTTAGTPTTGTTTGTSTVAQPVTPTNTAPATTTTAAATKTPPVTATVAQRTPPPPPPPVARPVPPPPATTTATAPPPRTADASRQRYDELAAGYRREAAGVAYSVQFELVCQTESVRRALQEGGSQVWFIPTSYRGQTCYRVFWGRYGNRGDAERGMSQIPAPLRGSKPAVIRPSELVK